MHIVILGTAYPFRGGLATFNERLARQFMTEGHQVEVYTFTVQYPSFLFPGKTQYSTEQQPKDIVIERCLNSCNPLNWIKVGKKISRCSPDMLICCYWMAFFAPAFSTIERIVKCNGKTRCISLVHNMAAHDSGLIDRMLAPVFVKNTDGFVALSKSVVSDIDCLDKTGKPKTFSPHPIYDHYGERISKEEACRHLSLPVENRYMLFFGLVRAYKGLDLLIDAMGEIKDKFSDVKLIVAGEFYEDEHKYKEQIKINGLTDKIIIHNEFISDSELKYYFGAADLIVQPYKNATQSGVTQVAFHFEKPMLVTNVGGLGEIVHHGKMGYAVEPQPQSIAAAIEDYYNNNRQHAFTDYLRHEKQKYGWDKMTKAFEDIYSQL